MKTNYERICAILESGHKAKVEYYISSELDDDLTPETVRVQYFQYDDNILKGFLKDLDSGYYLTKSITPIPTKPPILPVGTCVIILDNLEKCDYSREIGKVGIIQEIYDTSKGISYHIKMNECGYTFEFPHYTVCKNYLD